MIDIKKCSAAATAEQNEGSSLKKYPFQRAPISHKQSTKKKHHRNQIVK